jgi:hypothetical protein
MRSATLLPVIAGLDPAIHADFPLGGTFGEAFTGRISAWIRGSSPRMTTLKSRRARHISVWHDIHISLVEYPMRRRQSGTFRYTAGEIGRIRVIDDFLPPPADLVPREDNVKVTLSLSRRSLDFFKREAKKRRVPYQRMIRALVDTYAEKQVGGKKL